MRKHHWGEHGRGAGQFDLLHGIAIDQRGNVYVADPRSKMKNRFTVSRSKELRIFIEDDAQKARKLCQICEFVYLIAHPYNKEDADSLPRNVIRVSSLDDVRLHIRDNL